MLLEKLELCVERIQDKDTEQRDNGYKLMCDEVQKSTSSMTSVPKPLKFLQPHYKTIVAFYQT